MIITVNPRRSVIPIHILVLSLVGGVGSETGICPPADILDVADFLALFELFWPLLYKAALSPPS